LVGVLSCTLQVYRILVSSTVKVWSVYRRYTDFDTLDTTLRRLLKNIAPDQLRRVRELPGKVAFGNSDPKLIESRRKGLEAYLRDLLGVTEVVGSDAFTEFLEIPKARDVSTSPSSFHSSSARDGGDLRKSQ
jgi:hypothetical protein